MNTRDAVRQHVAAAIEAETQKHDALLVTRLRAGRIALEALQLPHQARLPRGFDRRRTALDLLRGARLNDRRPFYCLNQVGVPKRPEIKPADFARALEDEPLAVIPFEPQLFGTASNNGQMIAEVAAGHRTADMFRQLAQVLTGRAAAKKARAGLLAPLIGKLLQK